MMKTRFTRFMIGFLALISAYFLFVSSNYADEVAPVAKVVWVKGAFHATSSTLQSRSLQAGFPIYLHDTLVTDAQAQAQIVFTDNTLMTLRSNSNFYVDQYAYQPKTTTSQAVGTYVMRLVAGGFRTITGLIAQNQPSHYQVNTPVAVIGVRGTDYEVDLSDGQLFMRYYHGSPCVTSAGEALCLTPKTPYARVPGHHLPPVPLIQQPAQFAQPLSITQTTYDAVPLIAAGIPPIPPTPPEGGGGATSSNQSSDSSAGNAVSSSPPPPGDGSSATAAGAPSTPSDSEEGGVIAPEPETSSPAPSTGTDKQTPANQNGLLNSFCIQPR
jgi:hypothetical protein